MEGEGMVTKVALGLSALIMCGMAGVYVYKFHYEAKEEVGSLSDSDTQDKETQTTE
tara:strand:+ start:7265 stop:7432 length:168 start_codon:yes stop_codon:yes gene_type:complete